jgi:hypothetical protein
MMTAEEGRMTGALSRGESVPGGPGACAGCGHLTLWHGTNGRYRGKPCQRCDCPAFTKSAAADYPTRPPAELTLFSLEEVPRQERPRRRKPLAKASKPPVSELALFSLEEIA